MPWCPKCKDEFREGFTECGRCNVQLVDKLEEEQAEEDKVNPVYAVNEEWAFLINTKDEIEADSLEALLTSCEIPVLRDHNDYSTLANVYTGKSNFGANLLVPASRLEEAKAILDSGEDVEESDFSEASEDEEFNLEELGEKAEDSEDRVVYHKSRRTMAWLILLAIALLGFIGVVLGPSGVLDRLLGR